MKKLIAFVIALAPGIALAQTPITDANSLATKLTNLGNTFLVLLMSFAVIFIIFNIVRYLIVGAGGEDARKNARDSIVWGIVGLAIIFSIWGLVRILTNTFNTGSNNNVPINDIPKIPTPPTF